MNNAFFFFQSHKVLVCITKPFKKKINLSYIYSNTDSSLDAKIKKKSIIWAITFNSSMTIVPFTKEKSFICIVGNVKAQKVKVLDIKFS